MWLELLYGLIFQLASLWIVGIVFMKLLGVKRTNSRALVYGMVAQLALVQLIGYPMRALGASFDLFFWTLSLAMLAAAGYFLYCVIKDAFSKNVQDPMLTFTVSKEPRPWLLLLMVAATFAVYMVVSLGYAYPSTDDAYYLPRAMEMVVQNKLTIIDDFAWLGKESSALAPTSDPSTMEMYKAYWSRMTGVSVTALCKTSMSVVFHLISLLAVVEAAACLFRDKTNQTKGKCFVALFYMLLLVVENSADGSTAFWPIRYTSQGKAMLISFIIPMLLYGCADVVSQKEGKIPPHKWVFLAAVLTAGICSSIVGVYLPFLLFFSLGLPYLIFRWRDIKQLIVPVLLTSLPVIVFGGLTYINIAFYNTHYLVAYNTIHWASVVLGMFDTNHYLSLGVYAASLVYFAIRGTRTARLILIGSPVVLLLTFLNPLLAPLVARYVTTSLVYWRLLWLLPVYIAPAIAMGDWLGGMQVERVKGVSLGMACMLCTLTVFGVAVNGPSKFVKNALSLVGVGQHVEKRTNLYALKEHNIEIANAVLQDYKGDGRPQVLCTGEEVAMELRQYSVDISLATFYRENQRQYLTMPLGDMGMTTHAFLTRFFEGDEKNGEQLHTGMALIGANYLCLDSNLNLMPDDATQHGFEYMGRIERYDLWRVVAAD